MIMKIRTPDGRTLRAAAFIGRGLGRVQNDGGGDVLGSGSSCYEFRTLLEPVLL